MFSIVANNVSQKKALEDCGLYVQGNCLILPWGGSLNKKAAIETPVNLGTGEYDVGHIGMGSFFNIGRLQDTSTQCVIDADRIGRFCSVAPNVHIGFPEHSLSFVSSHPLFRYDSNSYWLEEDFPRHHDAWELDMRERNLASYKRKRKKALIGNDVWIGYGVSILNGCKLGDGCVIANGAVVTKDVAPYTIVGGVPARSIKRKFSDSICDRLLTVKWWDYGPEILRGLELDKPEKLIYELEERTLKYKKISASIIEFDNDEERIEYKNRNGTKKTLYLYND